MLGYVTLPGPGAADLLLAGIAATLHAQGWLLAGVIQRNEDRDPGLPCHMDLHLLAGNGVVRISQSLGRHSSGCRLDTAALAQAAGLVEQALHAGPRLLVVNKFGKQECEGRGFRPVIARALEMGVPVLTSVSAAHLPAFAAFAEDLARPLPAEEGPILRWCGG